MNPQYKKISHDYDRTIVVGDVHGCFTELTNLLSKIKFSDRDLLISVGDLVDRGPFSREVAQFFRDTKNAYSALGNHERKLAGTIRGTMQPAWSQRHSLSKLPEKEHLLWADYFESLPAVIETNHAIITHARLDPAVSIEKQIPYHVCAVGGAGVVIEKDVNGLPLWFTEWAETSANKKPLCVGHVSYPTIALKPSRLYALDTDAAKGGHLTAVIFPECKVVQVSSKKNYYEESRQEWSKIELSKYSPQKLPINKYFSIRNKEDINQYEKKTLDGFESFLCNLDFENKINFLKKDLVKLFGELPPPGPERGNYFMTIKVGLPSVNQRLISMVLSPKAFSIDLFLKLFEGANLQAALKALKVIQGEIESSFSK